MAIQFNKQYGETVVIATDKKIVFTREINGMLACYTIYPESFEFPDSIAERERIERVKMFLNHPSMPDEIIRPALIRNGNAVWSTVKYLQAALAGPQ